MDCMQYVDRVLDLYSIRSFNTASGMDCMQCVLSVGNDIVVAFQYRKRYGLHAIELFLCFFSRKEKFQYRKRYGLHAICWACKWSSPAWKFQYRKRYGLHAIYVCETQRGSFCGFNTASGMDCMQFILGNCLFLQTTVSIPQAVWIACNYAMSDVLLKDF